MNFLRPNAPSRLGFMALELLIVVAIILVLFCMYWGGGFGGMGKNDFASCARNLQFVHTSLIVYATDNNERFPSLRGAETSEAPLAMLVPKYTSQTSPFICPSSGDRALREGEPFAKKRISYSYVMGLSRTSEPTQFILSDEQVDTTLKPSGARVFSLDGQAPAKNHGEHGGNVLFIDGSVQMIRPRASITLGFPNGATLLNPKPKR